VAGAAGKAVTPAVAEGRGVSANQLKHACISATRGTFFFHTDSADTKSGPHEQIPLHINLCPHLLSADASPGHRGQGQ
jgi:hypothetical protein